MKKLILPFSLMLLGFTGIAINASAQGYDPRVDVSRLAVDESRAFRGDRDYRDWDRRDGRGEGRVAYDLNRLNREVQQVRAVINYRGVGPRLRERFRRVLRATDYLNDQFRRGNMRGWEIRRRSDAIRADLDTIRRDLRNRRIGIGGYR